MSRVSSVLSCVCHFRVFSFVCVRHSSSSSRVRQELNAKGEGAYKLSVNDFIIKAAALALQKKPTCNSAWFGDYIRRYVHPRFSCRLWVVADGSRG